ncbi:MAG: hypothetical protein M3R46_11660 [Actinomycetota bacterium]|nr:hypothetical protein [Actinomycetota bacterium]
MLGYDDVEMSILIPEEISSSRPAMLLWKSGAAQRAASETVLERSKRAGVASVREGR